MDGFLLSLAFVCIGIAAAAVARMTVLERRIRELGGGPLSPGDGGGVADVWLEIATAIQNLGETLPEAVRLAKLAAIHAQRSGYLTGAEFERVAAVLDGLIKVFPADIKAASAETDLILAESGAQTDYERSRLAARGLIDDGDMARRNVRSTIEPIPPSERAGPWYSRSVAGTARFKPGQRLTPAQAEGVKFPGDASMSGGNPTATTDLIFGDDGGIRAGTAYGQAIINSVLAHAANEAENVALACTCQYEHGMIDSECPIHGDQAALVRATAAELEPDGSGLVEPGPSVPAAAQAIAERAAEIPARENRWADVSARAVAMEAAGCHCGPEEPDEDCPLHGRIATTCISGQTPCVDPEGLCPLHAAFHRMDAWPCPAPYGSHSYGRDKLHVYGMCPGSFFRDVLEGVKSRIEAERLARVKANVMAVVDSAEDIGPTPAAANDDDGRVEPEDIPELFDTVDACICQVGRDSAGGYEGEPDPDCPLHKVYTQPSDAAYVTDEAAAEAARHLDAAREARRAGATWPAVPTDD
jgi:hypothetical protein